MKSILKLANLFYKFSSAEILHEIKRTGENFINPPIYFDMSYFTDEGLNEYLYSDGVAEMFVKSDPSDATKSVIEVMHPFGGSFEFSAEKFGRVGTFREWVPAAIEKFRELAKLPESTEAEAEAEAKTEENEYDTLFPKNHWSLGLGLDRTLYEINGDILDDLKKYVISNGVTKQASLAPNVECTIIVSQKPQRSGKSIPYYDITIATKLVDGSIKESKFGDYNLDDLIWEYVTQTVWDSLSEMSGYCFISVDNDDENLFTKDEAKKLIENIDKETLDFGNYGSHYSIKYVNNVITGSDGKTFNTAQDVTDHLSSLGYFD